MRYWLLKSDPQDLSFRDLLAAPRRRTGWDGVRNYQARNLLRDEVRAGDLGLYYHSGGDPSGVAGVFRVARGAEPDPTQFDPRSEHYDERSDPAAPTWVQVEVEALAELPTFVPLALLREQKGLRGMALLRAGQRLSVLPVAEKEWRAILELGGLDPDRLPGPEPLGGAGVGSRSKARGTKPRARRRT